MICELYPSKALIYKKVLKWKEKSKGEEREGHTKIWRMSVPPRETACAKILRHVQAW